jgi:PAS domain S-box-containing protein
MSRRRYRETIDMIEQQRTELEQRVGEGYELFRAVIDHTPAVIYVKDVYGRYLQVNRRYVELFKLAHETVVGKTDYDIFPKEAANAFRAMDERVVRAGVPLTDEEVAPHDDGPHTYISVKCPLRNAAGEVYAGAAARPADHWRESR